MGIGYLAGFAAAEIEEKIKARKRQKETAEMNKMFRESKNYEDGNVQFNFKKKFEEKLKGNDTNSYVEQMSNQNEKFLFSKNTKKRTLDVSAS